MSSLYQKKGFTFIEILLSLVIMGVISAGIYEAYVTNMRGKDVQEQIMHVQQNSRIAAAEIEKDLRSAGFGLDTAQAQPNFVSIGPYEMVFNSDIDQTVAGIDPAKSPDAVPAFVSSGSTLTPYDPPVKYANAETIRWSLDSNDDGQLTDKDKLINLRHNNKATNEHLFRLYRQVYGDDGTTNGGNPEIVAENIRGPLPYPDGSYPKPMFTIWIEEDKDEDGVLGADEIDVNGNGVLDLYMWGDDGSGGGTASNGKLEQGEIKAMLTGNKGDAKVLNSFNETATPANADTRLTGVGLPATTLRSEISNIKRIDLNISAETIKKDEHFKSSKHNVGSTLYPYHDMTVEASVDPRNPIIEVGAYPTLTVTATPTTVKCPATNSLISAVAKDSNSKGISGLLIDFSASGGSFASGGGPTTASVITDATGKADINFYGYNAGGGSATISAKATINGSSYSGMANVLFSGGIPSNISMVATPGNLAADGSSTSNIKTTVKDSCGNMVADGTTVTYALTTNPNGIGGNIAPPAATTTNGVANTTLIAGVSSGTATVAATVGAVAGTINVPFTSCILSLSPLKNSIPNDGTSTTSISAKLLDLSGIPYSNEDILFSTDDGSISPLTVKTDLSGQATTVLTSSIRPHTAKITGKITSGSCANTTGTTYVEFTQAGCDVVITSDKSEITYNDVANITTTFNYTGSNAPVVNAPISFTQDNKTLGSLSPTSTVTDASGIAVTSFTSGATSGTVSITASEACGFRTLALPILRCSAAINAVPGMVAPDGITKSTVTFILTDKQSGTPVFGKDVTFDVTGVVTSKQVVTTDANGEATITLSSGSAGIATITASTWCSDPVTATVQFNDWKITMTSADSSIDTSKSTTLTVATLKNGVLAQPPIGSSDVTLSFTDAGGGLGSSFITNPVVLSAGSGTSTLKAGVQSGTITARATININGTLLSSSADIKITEATGSLLYYDIGSSSVSGSDNDRVSFNIVNGHAQKATITQMVISWTTPKAYLDRLRTDATSSWLWVYSSPNHPPSNCGGKGKRAGSGKKIDVICENPNAASGKKFVFDRLEFMDRKKKSAKGVDMRGDTLTITFYYTLQGDSNLYSSTVTIKLPQ